MSNQLIDWLKKHIFLILLIILFPALLFFTNILSYVNTQLNAMKQQKALKVVVFDLDETLGYFTELSIFWEALENFYNINLLNAKFYEVADLFPEFFRPDILHILDFIHTQKMKKRCYKTIIYTNNQAPKSWVNLISEYCSVKLGYKVFDCVIGAYKVRGKQIELKRTSHEKSVKDLISCTDLPTSTEVCFIDDLYHPLMDVNNVYYINIKPYHASLTFEEMATRYYDVVLGPVHPTIRKQVFVNSIVAYMSQYNFMVVKKSIEEENVDKTVSKQLLANLEDFFKHKKRTNTRKRRSQRGGTPHTPRSRGGREEIIV
jgi:hypothetical protein